MTLNKVQDADRFIDLSDCARPLARRITRSLVNTAITPLQVTCTYGILGVGAATPCSWRARPGPVASPSGSICRCRSASSATLDVATASVER